MAKTNLIRNIHQVSVLNLLRRHGSTSRARLAQELGLTRSTLTSLVNYLLEQGYVTESGRKVIRHGTGRPGVGLELNAEGAFFVGAEIGYGSLRIVLLDLSARIVGRAASDFDMSDPPRTVVEKLGSLISEVRERSGRDPSLVRGIGVAVPATTADGRIVLSPALSWENVEVRDPLEKAASCPVLVENNANAAALAEVYFREKETADSLVFMHLGKGIGSGIVINGEIYKGAFGAAGEIGNMRLSFQGPRDGKGNQGTFEAFASMTTLMDHYKQSGGRSGDLEGISAEFELGLPASTAVVADWQHWVGQAVLMLVNVLNPQKIVLGGPLAPLLPAIMPGLEELIRSEQVPGSDRVEIVVSNLGEDTNALGGAVLAYHTMFSLPEISVSRSTVIDEPDHSLAT